jgi:hypothetical protein
MCDYSLHGIKNRLAVEGEQLFVNKFHTGSKGLASVVDLNEIQTPKPAPAGTGFLGRILHRLNEASRIVNGEEKFHMAAVCVPPGAKLFLDGIPKSVQEDLGVGEAEEVTFVQLTHEPFRYRDAVRFENGEEVLIQKIPDGVVFEVLSLELEEKTPAVAVRPVERSLRANA